MIRIALVIPTLDRSGAEKQLMLLASHLPREEFDVQVIALTRGGPYAEDLKAAGVPVTILNKRLKFDPVAAGKLRRAVHEWRPDVVHSWLFAANAYVRLAMRRSPGAGVPPAVLISERCVDSWKSGWQLWLDRWLISRTDHLAANSQAVAEFYQQVGYPAEKVSVIPNAVVTPPLPEVTRPEWLRSLQFPDDAKVAVYVGRLAAQKRIRDLLWACQLLRQADPRTRLVLIGDGPQRDRLIEFARQVEVAEYVRFLKPRPDAASLLHLADAFWLASDFEGMSNSLMEAMACGRPVVVSDIPPNRELVRHGEQGFLIDAGDGVGFAQFTRKLWDDPGLAERLGTAGRERVLNDFGLTRMIAGYVDLYRRLVAGRESASP